MEPLHGAAGVPHASTDVEQVTEILAEATDKLENLEKKKGLHGNGGSEVRQELEVIFNQIRSLRVDPKQAIIKTQLLTHIARLYGMAHYGAGYENSRGILLFSLDAILHFGKLAAISDPTREMARYASLEEWKTAWLSPANKARIENIESHFLALDQAVILERLHGHEWVLATNLRWLGHSYQNLPAYTKYDRAPLQAAVDKTKRHVEKLEWQKEHAKQSAREKKAHLSTQIAVHRERLEILESELDEKTHDSLFAQVYGTCEKALRQIKHNKDAKNELTELFYNTIVFLHYRKKPLDVKGAWGQFQNKVLRDHPSDALVARAFNLFCVRYREVNNMLMALEFSSRCIAIFRANPQITSEFTFANAHNNNARLRMLVIEQEKRPATYQEAEKIEEYLALGKQLITKQRGKDNDNPYFYIWELNIARWTLMKGNREEARTMAEKVVSSLKNNSKYSEEEIDTISAAEKFLDSF